MQLLRSLFEAIPENIESARVDESAVNAVHKSAAEIFLRDIKDIFALSLTVSDIVFPKIAFQLLEVFWSILFNEAHW